jgi:hypothetical protein
LLTLLWSVAAPLAQCITACNGEEAVQRVKTLMDGGTLTASVSTPSTPELGAVSHALGIDFDDFPVLR